MGAVYLDGGFSAAHDVTQRLFVEALRDVDSSARFDFKSRLQERSQAMLQATPQYTVVGQEGPDHDRRFLVAILLDGREYGRAQGRSKKEAEQNAAAQASRCSTAARRHPRGTPRGTRRRMTAARETVDRQPRSRSR